MRGAAPRVLDCVLLALPFECGLVDAADVMRKLIAGRQIVALPLGAEAERRIALVWRKYQRACAGFSIVGQGNR
jgi:hypothetical protein